MTKAKRSRRETLSPEDAQKLKQYKQRDKAWKIKLKKYWWDDWYNQASPEEKIKMKKELEQAEYRKEDGAQPILSDSEQIIFDLKIQGFKEADSRAQQTKEEKILDEYSRDYKKI